MSTVTKSIDVDVPVFTAFEQWTRFEELPRFVRGLHSDPANFVQYVTDYLGVLNRWVERTLNRFKEAMEEPSPIFVQLPAAEDLVGQ